MMSPPTLYTLLKQKSDDRLQMKVFMASSVKEIVPMLDRKTNSTKHPKRFREILGHIA